MRNTSPIGELYMAAILYRIIDFLDQNASMYKANGFLSTNKTSTGTVSLHFLLPVAILGFPLTSFSCIKHHRHYVLSCK